MTKDFRGKQLGEEILSSTRVEVHIPSVIEIVLVQANEFRHYEIAVWLSSLFFSAMTGFWTAYVTTPKNNVLLGTSIVFSVFTIVFSIASIHYRIKLQGSKIKRVSLLDNFK